MAANTFSPIFPSGKDTYTVYDMSADEVEKVESRMRPGAYSTEGFLSMNDRLQDVCVKDLTTLSELGISCTQVSYMLIGIIKKASLIAKELNPLFPPNEVTIENHFKVKGIGLATNGSQECPFHKTKEQCDVGRRDFVITNLKTHESFSVSELAIHLIGKHAFFEGNTPYRVDPEQACRVLELKPGEQKTITERKWVWCAGRIQIDTKEEHAARENAEKICQIDEFAVAYLGLPYRDYRAYRYRGLTEKERFWKQEKENGKTDAQIKRAIQFFQRCSMDQDLDAPAFVEDGKKYCHIFNRKTRKEDSEFTIEGIQIKTPLRHKGTYVLEYEEETYTEI